MDVELRARDERRRDDERRRRREVTRHLDLAQLQALCAGRTVTLCSRRVTGAPAASSMSSVWSRVGTGSTTVVSPVGVEAGEEDRRLHLRARDRELVRDPVQRPPLDAHRQVAVLRLDAGAHARERLGDPLHRPRAERRVADELELLPLLTRENAGEEPDERAGVAAVDRPARRLQPAQPLPEDAERVVAVLVDGDPERARTASIVDSVSAERPKFVTRVSPSQIAPRSTERCEIDLSPGTAMCPTSRVDRIDPHSSITGAATTP